MAAIFSFKCSSCGGIHEGSPSIGFRAPDPYLEQTKQIQDTGTLNSDLVDTRTKTESTSSFVLA